MPCSNTSKATLTCFLVTTRTGGSPASSLTKLPYRPCSHSTWYGSTEFSMICTKLQGSSACAMSRQTSGQTNRSYRGSNGAGAGPR